MYIFRTHRCLSMLWMLHTQITGIRIGAWTIHTVYIGHMGLIADRADAAVDHVTIGITITMITIITMITMITIITMIIKYK